MSIEVKISKALLELSEGGRIPDPAKWVICINWGDLQDLGADLDTKEVYFNFIGRRFKVIPFMDGFFFRGTVALFFKDKKE